MRHASNVTRLLKTTVGQSTLFVGEVKPKLLDRLREALRSRHYSRRTEQTHCRWLRRLIYFHNILHPMECLRLRVKGLDFSRNSDGKGAKDRTTLLPESLKTPLLDQMIYIHVLNRGPSSLPSPLDGL
jgi:hypothetical protein